MKIKDIPWFNRPGFKLTGKGVNTLDDAELLSIIFGVGSKGESALELSNKLLKKYNFNKLEDLSIKNLAKECNGNFNKALQIISLIEICKRYNKLINGGYDNKIKHKTINSAKDVKNIFIDKFRKEYKNLKYYCYILSSAISESELKRFKEEVSNQINSFNKKEKGMLRRIKFRFITRKAILEISNHFKDENKKLLFERNHPKFCEHFESKLKENEIIDSINLKDFFDEISRLSTPDTSEMRKNKIE